MSSSLLAALHIHSFISEGVKTSKHSEKKEHQTNRTVEYEVCLYNADCSVFGDSKCLTSICVKL